MAWTCCVSQGQRMSREGVTLQWCSPLMSPLSGYTRRPGLAEGSGSRRRHGPGTGCCVLSSSSLSGLRCQSLKGCSHVAWNCLKHRVGPGFGPVCFRRRKGPPSLWHITFLNVPEALASFPVLSLVPRTQWGCDAQWEVCTGVSPYTVKVTKTAVNQLPLLRF